MVPTIGLQELQAALQSEAPPKLLDVREDEELEISRFEDIVHVPMAELPSRIDQLDREAEWVVVCRTGNRSGHATAFLLANGFRSVRNMEGGMNGWAREVDPSVQAY